MFQLVTMLLYMYVVAAMKQYYFINNRVNIESAHHSDRDTPCPVSITVAKYYHILFTHIITLKLQCPHIHSNKQKNGEDIFCFLFFLGRSESLPKFVEISPPWTLILSYIFFVNIHYDTLITLPFFSPLINLSVQKHVTWLISHIAFTSKIFHLYTTV